MCFEEAAGGACRDGGVVVWTLRWGLLCCGFALRCIGIGKLGPQFFLERAAPPGATIPAAATGPATNTLVYAANQQGHVILDTVVNGASVRMLVDTGASFVTLTREDARAAG